LLYIVATPIGNLEDITLRALRILKEVDLIVCEDTRHSKILLNKYEIEKPLLSYHSHSRISKINKIIEELKKGKDVALVSDAGTPGISDPGYAVVTAALEEGIEVSPVPGTSAFLTALMVSGFPINQFVYLGFLPVKKGRQTLFFNLKEEKRTVVFYESPYRILKTLGEIKEYLGENREIVLARELTKKFEEFKRGTVKEVYTEMETQKPKGEFVVILSAN